MYNEVKKLIIITMLLQPSFLFCAFALYRNILRESYREIARLLLLFLIEEQLEGYALGPALVYKTIFGC
jgi:hypothetical protein